MSFILLFILLIALFVYWYRNDGVFYFKTNHVEISVTPAWIREMIKNFKEGKRQYQKLCKSCGTVIKGDSYLCKACDERFNQNYTASSGRKMSRSTNLSENLQTLKPQKYKATKLKEAVRKGGNTNE